MKSKLFMMKHANVFCLTFVVALLIDWAVGMSTLSTNLIYAVVGGFLMFIVTILTLGNAETLGILSFRDWEKISNTNVSSSRLLLIAISISLIFYSFLSFMLKIFVF